LKFQAADVSTFFTESMQNHCNVFVDLN